MNHQQIVIANYYISMSRCQLTQVQLLSTIFTHTLSESLLVSELLSEYRVAVFDLTSDKKLIFILIVEPQNTGSRVVVVVVVEDFGSWVSPPSLNCSLAPCPSTLTRLSVSGGVIPAKNPIYGCLGRPERTYSKVANGAIAIGS